MQWPFCHCKAMLESCVKLFLLLCKATTPRPKRRQYLYCMFVCSHSNRGNQWRILLVLFFFFFFFTAVTWQLLSLFLAAPVTNAVLTANTTEMLEFSGPVQLSISSSGSSQSFNWLNGTHLLSANERVQITEGGAVVTVLNVTRYDQGPYSCLVYNPVSTLDTNQVHLSISCESLLPWFLLRYF